MLLADLFTDKTTYALGLFHPGSIAMLEDALIEKNGKPYLRCLARDKEIQAKPEEIVRQLWLYRLMVHYQYSKSRITVEYPITFGRDSSKRADIVIFDADRPTVPYLVIEIKQANRVVSPVSSVIKYKFIAKLSMEKP